MAACMCTQATSSADRLRTSPADFGSKSFRRIPTATVVLPSATASHCHPRSPSAPSRAMRAAATGAEMTWESMMAEVVRDSGRVMWLGGKNSVMWYLHCRDAFMLILWQVTEEQQVYSTIADLKH